MSVKQHDETRRKKGKMSKNERTKKMEKIARSREKFAYHT